MNLSVSDLVAVLLLFVCGVLVLLKLVHLCARQWSKGKLEAMDGYMREKGWKKLENSKEDKHESDA